MSLKEEEEKRRGLWYTIKMALEEVREFLPALKDENSIVGSIFSMVMQGLEFFGKIFAHFSQNPVDLRQNLSSEELKAEGAQEFLDEVRKLKLEDVQRAKLLEQWRAEPGNRNLAWVALMEHFLKAGQEGLRSAQSIMDKQLALIKSSVMAEDSPERDANPDLAEAFKNEIFLIEEAELKQSQEETNIELHRLNDEREYGSYNQGFYENNLKQMAENREGILKVGKAVLTYHYEMYRDGAFGIPAPVVVQENRPDDKRLHEKFSLLNNLYLNRP